MALALAVCGCADRSERPATSGALATIPAGPDPLVLRVSRDGGIMTAVRYPALDSTVWRSSYRLPAIERVLGYHADDGYLSAVDTGGRPVRVDLRLGAVAVPGSPGSRQFASADGAVMYALNTEGDVARYTPVGDRWTVTPPAEPAAIVPLQDGSLVLVQAEGEALMLRRFRPPENAVVDSLRLDLEAPVGSVHGFTVGDRMFLSAGTHVMAFRTRDFVQDVDVDVDDVVQSLVSSPSGDRVFVVVAGENEVRVVDRFEGKVVSTIELPGTPGALRMDPLGRVLLVQGEGDVAWVIDVGTSSLVGPLRSAWRGDLPARAARRRGGARAGGHGDAGLVDRSGRGAHDSRRRVGQLVRHALERLPSARGGARRTGALPRLERRRPPRARSRARSTGRRRAAA